jgi:lysophospholipase L1-like esterase
MRLKGGHIMTKEFDSSKNTLSEADVAKVAGIEAGAEVNDVVTDDTKDADLTFSDDAGNTVAVFKDGHIKTKEFDSSEDEFIRKYLRNKKIVFIGDSLTDTRASITPWYYLKFIEKTECMPYNRGWSGSTVATGYNSMCDRLDLPANDSQERAANHLGFPSTADIVIFFGGTNDWCRLKDQAYGDLLAPATKETFCGAVKYMITGLKNRYPQSDIIVLNLHHIYDRTDAHNREVIYEDDDETKTATISVNNSGKSKEDYRKAIKDCADMYGIPIVDMANVGFSAIMNTDNQLYYVDGIHLSELGGEVMANYLIKQLKTILSKH